MPIQVIDFLQFSVMCWKSEFISAIFLLVRMVTFSLLNVLILDLYMRKGKSQVLSCFNFPS